MSGDHVPFEIPQPGIFLVNYKDDADLDPEKQGFLISQVKAVGASRRVGILFNISPQVWKVDMKIPKFWLGVTGDRSINLCAMAIVSASTPVQAAASFFNIANTMRKIPVAVQSFGESEPAMTWLRSQIGP